MSPPRAGLPASGDVDALPAPAAVLAVDGGNSKTDLALVGPQGDVLAAVRGPTVSHQQVGLTRGLARLEALAVRAARRARIDPARRPLAAIGSYCLAGVDSRADVQQHERGLAGLRLAGRDLVRGDVEAALRAGTARGWGVAVVCGAGINALGRGPDGRRAPFLALGQISGDWGGGEDLGLAALGAAVRARDGRGPRTTLERSVPAHFGRRRPADVSWAIERREFEEGRVAELAPLVYRAAEAGDGVADAIVARLADEVALMAIAALRRARLTRGEVDVVLAGGLLQGAPAGLLARVRDAVGEVAPAAHVVVLDAPPVLGAVLLGFDALGWGDRAGIETRLRAGLAGRSAFASAVASANVSPRRRAASPRR